METPAVVVVTEDDRAELVALLHRADLPPRWRERLEMVKGAALGDDVDRLCAWRGRSPRTVRRWLAAFQTGGLAALTDAPRPGRPRRAEAAYLAALDAAVAAGPRALEQPFDVWTSARLSAYLAETTGVRIVPGWLRVLLHRRGFVRGRPKHSVAHLKVAANPDRYELHFEDETHVETNPYLGRVWHRRGQQPVLPAAGTNRRLRVFGSVEARGRGRIEVLGARADSAGFARYLAALEARHLATGRDMILVFDNGSCHTSRTTQMALAEHAGWLEVVPLSRYSPELNPKEREWRRLKRDHRSLLAPTLRAFTDTLLAGLGQLGGERCDIIDAVPAWWIAGHRREPTGRPPGRPVGAKDIHPRTPRRMNKAAPT